MYINNACSIVYNGQNVGTTQSPSHVDGPHSVADPYHMEVRRGEILTLAAAWMRLENTGANERDQSDCVTPFA